MNSKFQAQTQNEEIAYFNHLAKEGYYEPYPDHEYSRILFEMGFHMRDYKGLLLDVGCGSGAFSIRLAKLGFQVFGLDINLKMIKKAFQLAKENSLNADFLQADARMLPFKDDTFDYLFCGCILHHIPKHIPAFIKESRRILKNDGEIFIFEPNILSPVSIYHYYLARKGSPNERPLLAYKIKKLLSKYGFYSIHISSIKKVQLKSSTSSTLSKAHDLFLNIAVDYLKLPLGLYFIVTAKKLK
jgi:ubiquinone/menaquinone biosynthesis C-methylase UbiE